MAWKWASIIAVLVTIQPAHAQGGAESAACFDRAGEVATEMLACGKADIARWDHRLNAAYRALLRQESGAARAALRREQRAWLQHHLSETRRLASDPSTGSGAFMISQSFEAKDLSERTLALEGRLDKRR